MALDRLEALKAGLEGIEESEQSHAISEHILALENLLKGSKPSTFSTVASEDLRNKLKEAGIKRKRLVFEPAKVAELADSFGDNVIAEVEDLHSRIKKIYSRVNMDHEPGSRMILDAILLGLVEIASTDKLGVAILPEMRIAQGDEVQITHPDSGYELWLRGNVDYAIIDYENVKDYKERLLAPGGSREDVLEIARGHLFIIARRQNPEQNLSLSSHTPEAVCKAIALLKSTNLPEVRFCLTDGQTWIFFILKLENERLTYYESPARRLSRDILETMNSDLPLRQIMQLVWEWLRPTTPDLYSLE